MISRLSHSLAPGIVLGSLLMISSEPAAADSRSAWSDVDIERFALPPANGSATSVRRFRLGTGQVRDDYRVEKTRPRWTYSPVEGGPIVEVGALGGRKGGPKLAHVRIDWRF